LNVLEKKVTHTLTCISKVPSLDGSYVDVFNPDALYECWVCVMDYNATSACPLESTP